MTKSAMESDDEQDARDMLLIAAHLLRTREFSDLDGLRTPGGDATPSSADWLADLVERAAKLPVSDLRRLAGLSPLSPGRRAVQSRFADAIDLGTKLAFDALRAKGMSYTEAVEMLVELSTYTDSDGRPIKSTDRRTIERRMKRAGKVAEARTKKARAVEARERTHVERATETRSRIVIVPKQRASRSHS